MPHSCIYQIGAGQQYSYILWWCKQSSSWDLLYSSLYTVCHPTRVIELDILVYTALSFGAVLI